MPDFESGHGKRRKLLKEAHDEEINKALEAMVEQDTARQIGELARTGMIINQELAEEMKPINDAEEQAYKDYMEEKVAVAEWNEYGRELPA